MIEKPTVLILGAGASKPYGLPLGSELRQKIINRLNLDGDIRYVLLNVGIGEDQIDAFRVAFELSWAPSIDSFLARRAEFADIGKVAIATIVKSCEWGFFPLVPLNDPTDHWLQYLWPKLDAPWHEFPNNRLRIITFNYDLSLDEFLVKAMRHTYGKSEQECREMLLDVVPIHHVYGSVGPGFGPPHLGMNNWVDYFKPDVVQKLVENIRVIPEGRDDSPDLQMCRAWLLEADRICFLGFGFDPINLRRLNAVETIKRKIADRPQLREVFASAFGLTAREMQKAAERCGNSPYDRSLHAFPEGFAPPELKNLETLRLSTILG